MHFMHQAGWMVRAQTASRNVRLIDAIVYYTGSVMFDQAFLATQNSLTVVIPSGKETVSELPTIFAL